MFRTVRRWFSTEETKQLADDVDKALEKLLDVGHAVEGLQRRIERHLNKLQMRDSRSRATGRGESLDLSDEEYQVLQDLRRQGNGDGRGDPFGNLP